MCRSKSFSFYEWQCILILKSLSNIQIQAFFLQTCIIWKKYLFGICFICTGKYILNEYLEITLFLVLKYKLGSLFSIFVMERTFFSFFSFPDNFIHRILQVEILSTYNLAKKNNYFCSHAFFWLEIPIQIVICIYVCICIYICMYKYIYV